MFIEFQRAVGYCWIRSFFAGHSENFDGQRRQGRHRFGFQTSLLPQLIAV